MVEKVVYVLGAGASYDAGGPLIRDFFSRESAKTMRVHSNYFDGDDKFRILEAAYETWARKTENPNVEGFFQRVDFQNLIGREFESKFTSSSVKPDTLYRYLVWYIAAFVRNCIADQRNPPGYYFDFASSLVKRGKRYSVLTFNYDLVLERAMLKELGELDYRLGALWGHKEFCKGVPLIKLHGSLNWLWCPKCGRIDVKDEPVGHKYNRISCNARCGGFRERLIVPPNPRKEEYLQLVYGLWRNAYSLLMAADRIVLVGYSLPDVDSSARELLLEPAETVKRFDIINSSPNALQALERKLRRRSDTPNATQFKDFVNAATH